MTCACTSTPQAQGMSRLHCFHAKRLGKLIDIKESMKGYIIRPADFMNT
jgi:hypothetical protein